MPRMFAVDVAKFLILLVFFGACGAPDPCSPGATRDLEVRFVGNPAGASPKVTLTGPATFELTDGQVLRAVPTGRYQVAANTYPMPGTRVRTAWAPTAPAEVCPGTVLEVSWSRVPTSGLLLVQTPSGSAGSPLGYADAIIAQAGNLVNAPAVWGTSTSGGDLAFDRHGNLWSLSNSLDAPTVQRYAAAELAASDAPRSKTPSVGLQVASNQCVPDFVALAFDPGGNLWVASQCAKQVVKLDAAQLAASASVTPALALSAGLTAPRSLAFDSAGNLWVSDDHQLVRFDASALNSSNATPARIVQVHASDDLSNADVHALGSLAFDRGGNLWSHDFGLNLLFQVPAEALVGGGAATVSPRVRIGLPVNALVEGLAFDEVGALWFATSVSHFARVSPAQLAVSTGTGSPVSYDALVATPGGSLTFFAMFPAPSWSPLYANLR